MAETNTHAGNLKLIGGRLCLDFANTVDWHQSEQPHEWLTSYSELIGWCRHAGVVTERESQMLLHEAAQQSQAGQSVLERSIALREAIYHIFSAAASDRQPFPADLATFNRELSIIMGRSKIDPGLEGFEWTWGGSDDALDKILHPIVLSAATLLASPEIKRVKECEGDPCGWLFLDTSRNRRRRWCAMEDCGNRAKARRYYWRHVNVEG